MIDELDKNLKREKEEIYKKIFENDSCIFEILKDKVEDMVVIGKSEIKTVNVGSINQDLELETIDAPSNIKGLDKKYNMLLNSMKLDGFAHLIEISDEK